MTTVSDAAETADAAAQDQLAAEATPPHRHDWWVRALGWSLLVSFVAFVVFAGVWRAAGGRWEVVQSPSMGTTAPVGSLLWTRPVEAKDLEVGDFISFHPPNQPHVNYSHRVYAINADGTLQTKGDIPGPDPWAIKNTDLVGKVSMVWRGVGWLFTSAPILVVGAIIILIVRRASRRDYKLPMTLILAALTFDVILIWYQPLTNASLVGSRTDAQSARVDFVNTGLLPVKIIGIGGSHVEISSGEVGEVRTSEILSDGRYHVDIKPVTPWWFWAGIFLACFGLPLYWLIVGVPIDPAVAGGKRRADPNAVSEETAAADPD